MQATAQKAAPQSFAESSVMYVKAPGTCGELMQGAIDGQDFLVNCPIDLFSYAKVKPSTKPGLRIKNENRYTKIRDTIMLAAQEHELDLSHHLDIHSDIPRGKGMASSSADITAAFEAICRCSKISLSAETFAHIVTEIEPSDLVHFPRISHLNHLTGQLFESMPTPRGMSILAIDCGGHIETVTFDRLLARNLYSKQQDYLRSTLKQLKFGLYSGDLSVIANAATRSAQFNQQIHFKPQFDDLLAISLAAGALGVNCAHSGTVLGVMYPNDDRLKKCLMTAITQHFGNDVSIIGNFQMINGGCYEY